MAILAEESPFNVKAWEFQYENFYGKLDRYFHVNDLQDNISRPPSTFHRQEIEISIYQKLRSICSSELRSIMATTIIATKVNESESWKSVLGQQSRAISRHSFQPRHQVTINLLPIYSLLRHIISCFIYLFMYYHDSIYLCIYYFVYYLCICTYTNVL